MLIPDGPRFVRIPGIFLLESHTLRHNPALLGSPFVGGYLHFLVSISTPESAVAVPTIPVCLPNFLLTELVTSAAGLSSLAEYGCCLKIYRAAGLWRRSGKVCLRTGLLSGLCMEELHAGDLRLVYKSICPLLFPVSPWSLYSGGNGGVKEIVKRLSDPFTWLACDFPARADAVTRNLRSCRGEPRGDGEG